MATKITHWMLPLLAAALPWSAGFRLLRWASRSDRTGVAPERESFSIANRYGYVRAQPDDASAELAWRRAMRHMHLIDHADLYLSLTRSDAWIARYVDVVGRWPASGPFLALTFHWGAGLWSLRHLASSGHRARFLVRRFEDNEFGNDRWLARYARWRIAAVERALGEPLIYTGNSTAEISAAFDAGISIVGGCDVPTPPGRSTIVVPCGSRSITMPLGILRLACARAIPVVPFAAGVDRTSGRRVFEIGPSATYADPEALANVLAGRLAELLEKDPVAWTLWPFADSLFGAASG